jgi:hypothetical protein
LKSFGLSPGLRLAPEFEMMEGMNQPSGELEPTDPTGESTSTKIRRCAVYARVSSSSHDDSPLSSIEAQIESCKAYVALLTPIQY